MQSEEAARQQSSQLGGSAEEERPAGIGRGRTITPNVRIVESSRYLVRTV